MVVLGHAHTQVSADRPYRHTVYRLYSFIFFTGLYFSVFGREGTLETVLNLVTSSELHFILLFIFDNNSTVLIEFTPGILEFRFSLLIYFGNVGKHILICNICKNNVL